MLALPKRVFLDLGEEAQEIAVVAARFDLGASTFCTMRTGRLIPWTMQVNCMSPLDFEHAAGGGDGSEEDKGKSTKN